MRLGSALAAALVASAAASGCGLNQEGIAPPRDRIFYPGAIALDPADPVTNKQRWLYVLNSNADLRFNDGTLVVVKLDDVHQVREDAVSHPDPHNPDGPPVAPKHTNELCADSKYFNPLDGDDHYCCWDALDRNILNCDERQFMDTSATVRLGSFGSALQFDPRDRRLFAAVRGNASITWLNTNEQVDSVGLDCGGSTAPGAFGECDDKHRVNLTQDPNRPIEEPYATAIDDQQGLLYVGHLRGGYLSTIDLDAPGGDPKLVNVNGGIFPGDVNGSTGVTSLTLTSTGINYGRIYATSRYLPRAGSFAPISFGPAVDNEQTFLANAGDVFVSPLSGTEVRGIQPIPLIHRTYVLQRTPPALIAFDTTVPGQNIASDIIEMCTGPTFLVMDPPLKPDHPTLNQIGVDKDRNKLLFVNCFEAGEVYVVDPYLSQIIAIIEVGRGPAGLALPRTPDGQHPDFGYVVGFGSNNVSVVDLRARVDNQPNPTQYHVIQRIGFPAPVPR